MRTLRGRLSDSTLVLTSEHTLAGFWETESEACLVRLYSPDDTWAERLDALLERPPVAGCLWPQELLIDDTTDCVGYSLAHTLKTSLPLSVALQPDAPVCFSWLQLHRLAYDLCSLFLRLHKDGYVLAGLWPEHIWLDAEGSIAIANVDALQFVTEQSIYLGCTGAPELTPPELLGKAPSLQTIIHDDFRLAVLMYQLLLGTHPYKGVWTGTEPEPDFETRVLEGLWLGNLRSRYAVPANALPLSCLSADLQAAFVKCFNAESSQDRPSCRDWLTLLAQEMRSLQQCTTHPGHYYSPERDACPWCHQLATLGTDPFAAAQPAPADYGDDLYQPVTSESSPVLEILKPVVLTPPARRGGAWSAALAILFVGALTSVLGYGWWRYQEVARQEAEVERQRQEELARQEAEVERQRQEELARQEAEVERQRQEELARQEAAVERQRQEELARQEAEVERQRQEELARQEAEVERQRQEDLARQEVEVERQRQEDLARQEVETERQQREELARQEAEAERQANIVVPEPLVAANVTEGMTFSVGNYGGVLIRTAIPVNAISNQGLARITSSNGFGVTLSDSIPGIFMYEQLLPPGQYSVRLERSGFCPYDFSFAKNDDIGVYNPSTGAGGIGIVLTEGC